MKTKMLFYWIARGVAAIIMLQTLYFKFTGASESVEIFTTVGMEPWGRYAVGLFELIASILLLINTMAWLGGGIALGLMAGAIGMHLTVLGIEVQGDGGLLFAYALVVAICAAFVLAVNKDVLLGILKKLSL
ncbi:hypothetical protein QQ054_33645 [Oscillatoria amoena NRMC-F 0135]|nr:hypothetical protein [Oscillatoria amoena NRMC-F 0135]